jgi:hypothetical protein
LLGAFPYRLGAVNWEQNSVKLRSDLIQ